MKQVYLPQDTDIDELLERLYNRRNIIDNLISTLELYADGSLTLLQAALRGDRFPRIGADEFAS